MTIFKIFKSPQLLEPIF